MTGILLTAGRAERMGNKTLLPQKNGKPIFMSAIEAFKRWGVNDVIIVYALRYQKLAMKEALARQDYYKRPTNVSFLRRQPSGVVDAILACEDLVAEDEPIVVLMGDNIYPDELLPKGLGWVTRESTNPYLLKIEDCLVSTPWIFDRLDFEDQPVDLLLRKMSPIPLSGAGWYDIGTPETYEEYLRS